MGRTQIIMVTVKYNWNVYPKIALLKAAYGLIDRCYVHMDLVGDELVVQITGKGNVAEDLLKNEFDNEILAQTVRYHVYQQTHNLRDMLVGRAMASTIINATPEDETDLDEDYDDDLDKILTDWFDKNEK